MADQFKELSSSGVLHALPEDEDAFLEADAPPAEMPMAESADEDPEVFLEKFQGQLKAMQDDIMADAAEMMKTGMATKAQKKALMDKKAAMSVAAKEMKSSIKASVTRTKTRELESLDRSAKRSEYKLMTALREKEIRSVIRAVCKAESVDLAFILDCTGSMGPHISGVKRQIKAIVQQVKRTNPNLNLRLSLVAYRDLKNNNGEEETKRFEVLDFVKNVDAFEKFVARLVASGGGDAPEDIAGAVRQGNELSWASPTRVVFLIADAPCHGGSKYHDCADDYPSGTPGIDIEAELKRLCCKHSADGSMTVNFGRICSSTDKMVATLNGAVGIAMETVRLDDAAKLTACVSTSVRKSIFKTMTATGTGKCIHPKALFTPLGTSKLLGGGKSDMVRDKKYHITPGMPRPAAWRAAPAVAVSMYSTLPITSVTALRKPSRFGIFSFGRSLFDGADAVKKVMCMRRAPSPFAEGACRLAYFGQLVDSAAYTTFSFGGEGGIGAKAEMVVLKSFKYAGTKENELKQYLKQMEVSNVADYLAQLYNKSSVRPSHCATVHFLQCRVLEDKVGVLGDESKGERRYCCEPLLPGVVEGTAEFVKYCNNTGYWDEALLDESLLRFSAFTHKVSEGYLMVADLQGVRVADGRFVLTDPVILCTNIHRFGKTNLGPDYIKRCLASVQTHAKDKGWA